MRRSALLIKNYYNFKEFLQYYNLTLFPLNKNLLNQLYCLDLIDYTLLIIVIINYYLSNSIKKSINIIRIILQKESKITQSNFVMLFIYSTSNNKYILRK